MQFEQVFSSAIEVGIATAGFSGIVVVLGQRAEGEWSELDIGRVALLLQASLAAILLSFLALVLQGAGMADTSTWRIGSAAYAAYVAVATPLILRQLRRLREIDPSYSTSLARLVVPTMLGLLALQVYNAVALGAGWAFALAVIVELVMAFLMFVRLLRTVWEQHAD